MAIRKAKKKKEGLPPDLEDDIDLFHKGKEKVSLNSGGEDASEDDISDEDIDVYNLGDSEDDESDSEDEGRLADCKLILCLLIYIHGQPAISQRSLDVTRSIP